MEEVKTRIEIGALCSRFDIKPIIELVYKESKQKAGYIIAGVYSLFTAEVLETSEKHGVADTLFFCLVNKNEFTVLTCEDFDRHEIEVCDEHKEHFENVLRKAAEGTVCNPKNRMQDFPTY